MPPEIVGCYEILVNRKTPQGKKKKSRTDVKVGHYRRRKAA